MSAKKISALIVLVVLLSLAGYFYFVKIKQAKKLSFGVDSIKPNFKTVGELSKSLLTGGNIPVIVKPLISNYSSSKFKLNQIKLDIYSQDEKTLLGSQSMPLANPIELVPNANNTPAILYTFNPAAFANSAGRKLGISEIIGWYQGKPLGVKLKLKGFFVAEGIKLNIDEVITV